MKSLYFSTICFLLLSNTYSYSSQIAPQQKSGWSFPLLRKIGILKSTKQNSIVESASKEEWIEIEKDDSNTLIPSRKISPLLLNATNENLILENSKISCVNNFIENIDKKDEKENSNQTSQLLLAVITSQQNEEPLKPSLSTNSINSKISNNSEDDVSDEEETNFEQKNPHIVALLQKNKTPQPQKITIIKENTFTAQVIGCFSACFERSFKKKHE
jgi:hypothetical protein